MAMNGETLQIIQRIDALGAELRKSIEGVHERLDSHLSDCRDRHNGTNLQEMDAKVESLQDSVARHMAEMTGGEKAALRAFDVIIAAGMLLVGIIGLIGVFR